VEAPPPRTVAEVVPLSTRTHVFRGGGISLFSEFCPPSPSLGALLSCSIFPWRRGGEKTATGEKQARPVERFRPQAKLPSVCQIGLHFSLLVELLPTRCPTQQSCAAGLFKMRPRPPTAPAPGHGGSAGACIMGCPHTSPSTASCGFFFV
jgi:hypothetical protein